MKKKYLILSFFLIVLNLSGYSQINFEWGFNPLDSLIQGGDIQGNSIKLDNEGHLYVVGYFQKTADFDPGIGNTSLTAYGLSDIFIAKYDTSGYLIYVKRLGGYNNDYASAIFIDENGDIYVTGSFQGVVDFDPGTGTKNLTSNGYINAFIAKYDSDGNYIYAKCISAQTGNSIAVDKNKNVYITGRFKETADFDPGESTINLTSVGDYDIFIAKYDSSGNYVYARGMGGSAENVCKSIGIDTNGNVYITGYFTGTVDFDPGLGTASLTFADSYDAFIAKYDGSGDYVYAKRIGGTTKDVSNSIAVESNGNIYITGYFTGTVDFDPGEGTNNLVSAGEYDAFVAKYDVSGKYLFAKRFGSTVLDWGNSIVLGENKNVYVTGSFYETGDSYLSDFGYWQIFIAEYDTAGNNINLKSVGIADVWSSNSIDVDPKGNTYITGYFKGKIDCDPNIGIAEFISPSSDFANAFIAKYNAIGEYIWAGALGGYYDVQENQYTTCEKIDKYGNIYITGVFEGKVDFDPGPGKAYLIENGNDWNSFIAKYDASGNLIFAKRLSSNDQLLSNSIAVDKFGAIYITGYFKGTADFDLGAGTATLTSEGEHDIFIAKYDSSGNYVYSNSIGGPYSDISLSIAIDKNGNVYITGNKVNIFIAKFNCLGTLVYEKTIGSTGNTVGTSIGIDKNENVYITGEFQNTVDFDPDSGTANFTSSGEHDIFIAKYDSTGNYVYAIKIGGSAEDFGASIAVDPDGNILITGVFSGNIDFDPDAGMAILNYAGEYDIFIAKYDSSGNYIYAKGFGGNTMDYGTFINTDKYGNTYVLGYFTGTVDFDPDNGKTVMTEIGGEPDIFIAKYDPSGNFDYVKQVSGSYNLWSNSISIDSSENIYIAGTFEEMVDFGSITGLNSLQSSSGRDIFLAKFSKHKEINILGNSIKIMNGDETPNSIDNTDFGYTNLGETISKTFTIENTGIDTIYLTDTTRVKVSGPGFILSSDAPATIPTGSSTTFQVTFTPQSCGTFLGTINIANNTTNNNPYYFTISGTGVDNIVPLTPTIADAISECSVTPAVPTTIDVCAGIIMGTTNTKFPVTIQGTTVVIWTFDDGNGNSINSNQNITIHDVTYPNIECIADTVINLSEGKTTYTVKGSEFDLVALSDNCQIDSIINNYTSSASLAGITLPIGTTTL